MFWVIFAIFLAWIAFSKAPLAQTFFILFHLCFVVCIGFVLYIFIGAWGLLMILAIVIGAIIYEYKRKKALKDDYFDTYVDYLNSTQADMLKRLAEQRAKDEQLHQLWLKRQAENEQK